MSWLLFEIYSEEIPAKVQKKAVENLQKLFNEQAVKLGVNYNQINCYVTPRRLVLIVDGIGQITCDSVIEKKGPRTDSPQEAVNGFLKTNNILHQDLVIKEIKGQEFYFANIVSAIQDLQEIIIQIINHILHNFPWPKTMRWEEHNIKWVRPIRNILCIFDGRVVPIKFGNLVANNLSVGHYFTSAQNFTVNTVYEYKKLLKANMVILDSVERREIILTQAKIIADELGLKLLGDEVLLEEVVGLVEYPVVLLGKIDQEFLQVPKEVLISVMKTHQKYLSLLDQEDNFAPYFIFVANVTGDKQQIIQGNERVLKARLYDAKFFYDQDRKTNLKSKIRDLERIVFHTKLGSSYANLYQKTKRIERLSEIIAKKLKDKDKDLEVIKQIACLAKADLTTNLVREFPELQGVVGKYYALNDGESEAVADGILEHYLPVGRIDNCPNSIESGIVAIADKLDTICGLFSIDEVPTSSKDPYGLRRSALGIIRIIIEYKLNISLLDLISESLKLYADDSSTRVIKLVLDFFHERFKFWLKDNFRHDFVNAVLNKCHEKSEHLYKDYKKIYFLEKFAKTSDGKQVLMMLNRVSNFIKGAILDNHIDEKLITEGVENILYKTISKFSEEFGKNISDLEKTLETLTQLVEPVNNFCDQVTVINKMDEKLSNNRLKLLSRIHNIVRDFADFTVIEY